MTNATASRPPARVPGYIRFPGPIVNRLLRYGLPIGPNALLTVRGRKSGEPRHLALAVMQLEHRRWVIGTFGDVNWCRNMRANPEVDFERSGIREQITARELPAAEAEVFFRDLLPQAISRMRPFSRLMARLFVRFAAGEIQTDPALAATRRPVFELLPTP